MKCNLPGKIESYIAETQSAVIMRKTEWDWKESPVAFIYLCIMINYKFN